MPDGDKERVMSSEDLHAWVHRYDGVDLTKDPGYVPEADYGDGHHDYDVCKCQRCQGLLIDAEFWR